MKKALELETGKQFAVELGDRGRIVLPAPVRRQFGLKEGDKLILTLAEDSIQLSNRRYLSNKFKGMFQLPGSKKSVVNEFIAERRREVKREH